MKSRGDSVRESSRASRDVRRHPVSKNSIEDIIGCEGIDFMNSQVPLDVGSRQISLNPPKEGRRVAQDV
ncbi:hypothetical protein CDAR_514101 [Caerostris darwini]|uniref:Uncharacterized protein n=1 Tax=Caerostris darwini TaxID=1538125 RepID=A0AAV4UND5_9ARAC|nr:hypothetical protein CDAR_514101 [Caerostris darwini]